MKKKDLFNIIKNRLEHFDALVDVNEEWQSLLKRKNKGKKKRYFLLTALLLFLVFSGGGYLLFHNNLKPTFENNSILITEELNKNETSPQSVIQSKGKEEEEEHEANTESNLLVNNDDKNNIGNQTIILKNNQKAKNIKTSDSPEEKNIVKAISSSYGITVGTNTNKEEDKPLEQASEAINKKNPQESFSTTWDSVKEIPTLTIFLQTTHEKKTIAVFPTFRPSARLLNKEVGIYVGGGIGQTQQIFTSKKASANTFLDNRNSTETSLETYTFSIAANFLLTQKSFLNTNLAYHQWHDRVNHQFEKSKDFFRENVLLERVSYASGFVDEIYGDTTLQGTQTTKITHFNKYSSVNVGINWGYYFLQKSKWEIALLGGLDWSIFARADGKTIDANEPIHELVENDGYKKSFGFGVSVGLQISYQLNNFLSFQLQPSSSYLLNSMTTRENYLKANLFRYGMTAGLRYDLTFSRKSN